MCNQSRVRQAVRASLLVAVLVASGGVLVAQVSLPAPYVDPFAVFTTPSTEGEKRPSPVLTLGTEGGYVSGGEADYWNGPTGRAYIGFDYATKYFDLLADLSVYDNTKYGATSANVSGGRLGHLYFLMDNGGARTHLGPLSFSAGRFQQYDVIDSPYSLFVNSNGNSALGMRLDYEDDFFFFETRWTELNSRSDVTTLSFPIGFPDRGANLKIFGFKIAPGMRFGFQDAAVYTGRSFDAEYFFNPIPGYFIQYGKSVSGSPWATGGYENEIVGMFWDWKRDDGLSLNAQLLIDDFSVFGLGGTPNNPWKLAWTMGGRKKTDYGTFGFYQAGATKYTFQTVAHEANGYPYSYTYYPDTVFNWDGQYYSISIEDNSLGYKYGEDNLAFMVDWSKRISGCDLYASLELLLAGTNSPNDAWDGLLSYPGGTEILDNETIEKRILGTVSASWRTGPWRIYGSLTGGVAIDPLALEAAPNYGSTSDSIYVPQAGNVQLIMRLTIGASYSWTMR
ncbi:MAG: hypothetical protein ABSF43_01475 [Rectinemataceae bacterium]|jgi:hypothetical protein